MSLSVEDARFVAETRMLMLKNMQEGRVPEAGIDKEKLKRALELVRKDRSIGEATNSKAKGKKKENIIPLDLGEFMKKKK